MSTSDGDQLLEEEERDDEEDEEKQEDDRFVEDFFPITEVLPAETLLNVGSREEKDRDAIEPHKEIINVNNIPVEMKTDTGATIAAVSEADYNRYFPKETIHETKTRLKAYNKQLIPALGYLKVKIERDRTVANQVLYVIRGGGAPIVGRRWLRALGMWPPRFGSNGDIKGEPMNVIKTDFEIEIAKFKQDFPSVSSSELLLFTKGQLHLKLQPEATPKFIQPRRVPISLRNKVEQEIQRLQSRGIIAPIEFSEWGTPVVPVLKRDGSVRLCGDYKITLNKYLVIDRYPLPRLENVLDAVRGAIFFTKLDLSEAYQQLPLAPENQKLVVISTHLGLFKYLRLPYSVSTGPGSFQRIMATLLLGIPGVMVFLDDTLVATADVETHKKRLREVFSRLQEAGLYLNFRKCSFFQKEIEYLGYKISKQGISPLKCKIEAVKEAPQPRNIPELRSFL